MYVNEVNSPTDKRRSVVTPAQSRSPAGSSSADVPFVPVFGMRNSHVQTICGGLLSARVQFHGTVQRKVQVPDGDLVILHDDQPDAWKHGDLAVILLHGLSGCHGSSYMMRIASKLNARNVRTFRMDHRGCGAGFGLANNPYHAGRVEDLQSAIDAVACLTPESPIALVGFSLSGNLVLRYLGDLSLHHSHNLLRAVAVSPPVDLEFSVRELWKSRIGLQYDWYFTRRLINQIAQSGQWREDLPLAREKRMPRRLYDFDDLFTAPASGFSSAEDYYQFASARDWLDNIRVPTTILASRDDPLVSVEPLLKRNDTLDVTLCLTEHGGHLGFFGRRNRDPDGRWMDWRIVEWLTQDH